MPNLPDNGVLAGRVALITGAARNIGRASAIALADAGAHVFVTDIDGEGLADTVAQIERVHGSERAIARVLDLADPDAPAAVVDGAVAQWGRVDTVVHSAVDLGRGTVDSWTVAQWDTAHAVNVRSAAFLVQAALPSLTASDQASVVLLSSVHAYVTHPGCALYSTTKGALDALTRGLAVELGPAGIRVNAIHPGWVPGKRITPPPLQLAAYPLGRVGEPEDIAAAVVFLASSASAWTTGAILTIDGGSRALSPESSAHTVAHTAAATDSMPSRVRRRIRRFGGPTRR